MLQCQHLSLQLPNEGKTFFQGRLIPFLYLYPPLPPLHSFLLCIHSSLYGFLRLWRYLTPDLLEEVSSFFFLHESSPSHSHCCLPLSLLFFFSLFRTQTALVSVGESYMNQHIPHRLFSSLCLFPFSGNQRSHETLHAVSTLRTLLELQSAKRNEIGTCVGF